MRCIKSNIEENFCCKKDHYVNHLEDNDNIEKEKYESKVISLKNILMILKISLKLIVLNIYVIKMVLLKMMIIRFNKYQTN